MPTFQRIIGWLPFVLLTACVASQIEAPTAGRPAAYTPGLAQPSRDRLMTAGEIQVAEQHLRDFGFDPGPVDGVFTTQTQAAIRAFQARYGIPVSGLLDHTTRLELLPGLDVEETEPD